MRSFQSIPANQPLDLAGLVMITGGFGSGKTEVSVNLALQLTRQGSQVHLVDLDLINPYFRSREARSLLEDNGVHVVVPGGALAYADLPIVLPEVAGLCRVRTGRTHLFDVGGDDLGARALAALNGRIVNQPHEHLMVINARRPFTQTVAGCLAMQEQIEAASRLKVTGLLVNTHLMSETTPEAVLEGWRLARKVSSQNGLPVRLVAVSAEFAEMGELACIDTPVLWLRRHMLPPWLVHHRDDRPIPAERPTPIGVPRYHFTGDRSAAEHPLNTAPGLDRRATE